jgi:TonB family protein
MAVCLACLALTGLATATPSPAQAPYRIDTVDKWDQAIQSVRKMATSVHTANDKGPTDVRGRVADQDWSQYILTADADARLAKLREKVGTQAEAKDYTGVAQTMTEAGPLVEAEVYKANFLASYWLTQNALIHHRQIMQGLPSRLKGKDRSELSAYIGDHMKQLELEVGAGFAEGIAADPVNGGGAVLLRLGQTRAEAIKVYNQKRADRLAALTANSKAVKVRKHEGACPPAATATSGGDKPKLAPSDVSLIDVYPANAQRDQMEGRVVVHLSVSETGCMERAEIETSSGADELDEAALTFAERARFVPAEKNGKASAGEFSFAVQFRLEQ